MTIIQQKPLPTTLVKNSVFPRYHQRPSIVSKLKGKCKTSSKFLIFLKKWFPTWPTPNHTAAHSCFHVHSRTCSQVLEGRQDCVTQCQHKHPSTSASHGASYYKSRSYRNFLCENLERLRNKTSCAVCSTLQPCFVQDTECMKCYCCDEASTYFSYVQIMQRILSLIRSLCEAERINRLKYSAGGNFLLQQRFCKKLPVHISETCS